MDKQLKLRHGNPLYSGIESTNIVEQYQNIIFSTYMDTHPNANPQRVHELIEQMTSSRIKNIPCVMHNNMTHEKLNTSIIDVCSWVNQNQPIIAGNGTFLKQHEEYTPPIIDFIESLQARRDDEKETMYTFQKGSSEYKNAYTAQISVKVIMNADYGGSGTVYSPFYSVYIPPATTSTAKNLTTTLICCLEFSSGNEDKWCKLHDVNELFDMMFTVLNANVDDRELIIDTYSVNEVLQYVLSKMDHPTVSDTKCVRSFLSTLQSDQLTRLRLAFDIKHVLTQYLSTEVSMIADYANHHIIDPDNTSKESLNECGFGELPPAELSESIEHVKKVICDNCIYPFILNDNEFRAAFMKRLIVCTTDTDSLMVHFASYVDAFQTRQPDFRTACLSAAVLGVRLFVDSVIPQYVKYIAGNYNIKDEYYRNKFVFKNEFGFLSMALLKKKMYAASTFVQEGNPRDTHDISVTGLSFKKRDAAEFLEPIMLELYDKYVLTSKTVEIDKLLDAFYELRNKLKLEIKYTTKYYKVLSIKDISSYDASRTLPSQMRGAIIWNNIRPDEELLPMDRVIQIPLSQKLMEQYANQDSTIADILTLVNRERAGTKSNMISVICLPESYKDIPDWLQLIIDDEYAIDQLLTPFKQLFDLFDVNMADTYAGMLPSRMICL